MDKFLDGIMTALQNLASWLLVTFVASSFWLVRRILTNQREIEMLRQEMRFRDETRLRDREDITDMKKNLREVHSMLVEYVTHGDIR